ncbi:MAG TPA: leucyl aminopeptidase [Mycobacteriales bacterium]|nr:leucyl aminopeptidase [Mycobacteriales bacterium]
MTDAAFFADLCTDYLRLCNVTDGETALILSQGDERLDYANAFMHAARRLGARAYHVRVPQPAPTGAWEVGGSGLADLPEVVEAAKNADIVIDLLFMLFSKEQLAIQAAGTRIALAIEPVDLLARLFPTTALRDEVLAAEQQLSAAKTLRFTNDAGTDVTYRLGTYPTISEYGYADQPGRWDHWPAAFVFTGAADDGVQGRIVIAPGDVLLPFNSYAASPIELTIENGFIVDIRGGLDAELVSSYMRGFEDPRGYGMSHVGWGLDPRAHWHGLTQFPGGIGMELRSFRGNVMFSIGPNSELGGPNDTACHLDIPMRNCSLYLDDREVVKNGQIVG